MSKINIPENEFIRGYNRKESYSSLSLLKQCPYKYYLRYIKQYRPEKSSLALELGNICHKAMELLYSGESPDTCKEILAKGFPKENLIGVEYLKEKYFEEWMTPSRKSQQYYENKIEKFYQKIVEPHEDEWKTIATEKPFELKYKGITIVGKIDRIDKNDKGELRVVDYKTNDQPFDEKELKTPLQMYIYALACKKLYKKYPTKFLYDFILIGEQRDAMTKGWEKRGEGQLDKIIGKREEFYTSKIFTPSPTPLCYWCDYCDIGCTKETKNRTKCDYYSLWSPTNKTFEVNKEFSPFEDEKEEEEFVW